MVCAQLTVHGSRLTAHDLLAWGQMRRGFSILLVLVFGLMPLSALIEGSDDANLPVCCRRHGSHHCASGMRTQIQPGSARYFAAPSTCPFYPGATAVVTPSPALTAAAAILPECNRRARVNIAANAVAPTGPNLTHAGRGPPQSI
jgi:hypothetical protein